MPVSQEKKPRGGKKSPGVLTTMNSIVVSKERGASWKMFGYTIKVSSTMLPKRIIITHRYTRANAKAICCLFTVCSSSSGDVTAI
jgi:hypothetical protein